MTKEKKPTPPSSGNGGTAADGTTVTCAAANGGIEWHQQPGATDEDLVKAKKMWADAKSRRLPDGSKPATVAALEALECSAKKTMINVGPSGNGARPDSRADAGDPSKGSNANIDFNPDKTGNLEPGVDRDPESSLAHEAYHAYEYTQGTSGTTRQEREVNATGAENWHRKAKGIPQRTKYGSWDIPQH